MPARRGAAPSTSAKNYEFRPASTEGGIEPADAIWMLGLRIKNAIHGRYGLEDGIKNEGARLRYVAQNPDSAPGGPRNADAEVRRLTARREDALKRYSELLPALEQMLCDLASDWPHEGLSDQQMLSLDNIFVNTPEIRLRLAQKIGHLENRNWLLKRNLGRLQGFLGLVATPTEVRTGYFNLDERQFAIIVPSAASSLTDLYAEDRRGVGKRTSDLVAGIAKAAESLVQQPFIAARQPEAWQSIITRAAAADIFALMVVESVPEERRAEVDELNKLALDHARIVLSAKNPAHQSVPTLDRLAARAI